MEMERFLSATEEEVKQAEKRLQVKFPEDYRKFLMEAGGGYREWEQSPDVLLKGIPDKINIRSLFGIHPDENCGDMYGLFYWMELFGDDMWELPEMEHNSVIIGNAWQNGFVFLICEGEHKGVYYWDDSCVFETSNEECAVYYIADSFTDFLRLL